MRRVSAMLMVTCPTCGGVENVRIGHQPFGGPSGWLANCSACGGIWDLGD